MNKHTLKFLLICFTLLLFFSTFTCGMWIGFSGEQITLGDKLFHMGLALLTLIFTFISTKYFTTINSKGVSTR